MTMGNKKISRPLTHGMIWIFCGIAIAYAKKPELITHPRIWAEEGSVYFQNAFNHTGWLDFLTPHMGYYSLINKLAVYIGLLLPLEWLPTIFLIVCVMVYLSVLVCILIGTDYLNLTEKMVFWALLIFSATGEVWVNTITLQFWLGISILVIYLDTDPWGPKKRILYGALLLMGFLTGPMGTFLLPFFLLRHRLLNVPLNGTLQLSTLLLAGIQLGYLLITLAMGAPMGSVAQGGERLSHFSLIASLKGFLGYYIGNTFLSRHLYDLAPTFYAAGAILLTILLIVFGVFTRHLRRPLILFAIAIYLSAVTIALSINGMGGLRYALVPAAAFFLALLDIRKASKMTFVKVTASILLALALCLSVMDRDYKFKPFYSEHWPDWKTELREQCWNDRACQLSIWPQAPIQWQMDLKPGNRSGALHDYFTSGQHSQE